MIRRMEIKAEKLIGGNRYFIRPIPAFKCANISGELAAMVFPILGALAPLAGGGDNVSLLDVDASAAAPALASGLSQFSGDKVESLLKKLLTTHNNVSVELEGENQAQALTENLADDIFCGDVQDMYILAYEVIRVNFSGFFKNLGDRFGSLLDALLEKIQPGSKSTEN